MNHQHHASAGCNGFDLLANPPRKASETPDDLHLVKVTINFPQGAHERNQNKLMGIDAECIECLKMGRLLGGDWHFLPGDKEHPGGRCYCGECAQAEASE
jgi:hypothetical protein